MRSHALALFVLAAPTLAQSVHVVDASGAAGSFTQVQDAVDAAASGDLVLVKSGSYAPFQTFGKAVSVVADDGAVVMMSDGVLIDDLPLDEQLVISGLNISEGGTFSFDRVNVDGCQGNVLFQDVIVSPSRGAYFGCGVATVRNSRAVTFVNSVLAHDAVSVCTALDVESSRVHIHDSFLLGPPGAPPPNGNNGGAAVWIGSLSRLLVTGSFLQGGSTTGRGVPSGADGGPAFLFLSEPGFKELVHYGNTLFSGFGVVTPPPIQGAGNVVEPAVEVRTFEAPAVARAGTSFPLTFRGEPGDLLWLFVDLEAISPLIYSPLLFGTLHTGLSPVVFRKLPSLDANGERVIDVDLNPTGVPFIPTWMQGLMLGAADGFVVSNPRFVALLDGLP